MAQRSQRIPCEPCETFVFFVVKKSLMALIPNKRINMISQLDGKQFVVCINNNGNEASLDQWKIYQSLPDEKAEKHNEIRIIDEEGEDYLYPCDWFSPVLLEPSVAKILIMQQQKNIR